MTGLRHLIFGVLILGTVMSNSFNARAAGPDTLAPDRELVLGLRVAPPFAMKTPDGAWTGITVELWRLLCPTVVRSARNLTSHWWTGRVPLGGASWSVGIWVLNSD
jgi:ABC-type amino acid transport substrate-binding protein